MTTGHINSGYGDIVSKNSLALDNPRGFRTPFNKNTQQLKEIKEKAKNVWSVKDNFQTTYGRYHGYHKYDKQIYRPSSPSRKNNPHPTKVFLTTRMTNIPGYFDDNDFEGKINKNSKTSEIYELASHENGQINSPLSNLESDLKQVSMDTKNLRHFISPTSAPNSGLNLSAKVTKSMYNLHNNSTGDSEYRAEYQGKSSADEIDTIRLSSNGVKLQSNSTNPFLYNDYRVYKEKYANKDHGVPNPDAKKYWPSRGEFLIHPDWHARLKHHQLPCNC